MRHLQEYVAGVCLNCCLVYRTVTGSRWYFLSSLFFYEPYREVIGLRVWTVLYWSSLGLIKCGISKSMLE